jgi:hypothetical protein
MMMVVPGEPLSREKSIMNVTSLVVGVVCVMCDEFGVNKYVFHVFMSTVSSNWGLRENLREFWIPLN